MHSQLPRFLVLLVVTAGVLRVNIDWRSVFSLEHGQFDPKFQVDGVVPTNHSPSQNTRLNGISYGVKIWTDLSSILSQSTRWQTDRQTDGRTHTFLIASPRWHCMQRGKSWINTNRKFTTRFPMNLTWTSYVAPKPPKALKRKTAVFGVKSHFVWRKSAKKWANRVSRNLVLHMLICSLV